MQSEQPGAEHTQDSGDNSRLWETCMCMYLANKAHSDSESDYYSLYSAARLMLLLSDQREYVHGNLKTKC